ncbi:MAG: channel protein TolC [Betaproteobacteria bacterium RIFCSPLOWO2_12_FULL_65_14]|nr:MAG: channel protein TolC [Betaproteobacteria bacterium RIFCSPLOWO2_12_FULL_65_14]
MNRRLALATAFAVFSLGASAEDLVQVYRDAQRYDAVYAAARHTLDAGRERLPQGRALILPTLNLSGNATRSRTESDSRDTSVQPSFVRNPSSIGYTLTLAQPIFRPQNWLQYRQAEFQVAQAEASFGQASQDLIVRVAQAYFDVLASQDTLGLVRAQKAAISEQLAQAKRNFEVGTATITDTHEAQARYDLISAQEIAAQNDLENRRRALQLITGKEYRELKSLRSEVKLSPPNPNNMETWVELAEKQSYPVQIQEAASEVAALEAKRASAGHLPTLDAVATYGQTGQTASTTSNVGADITSSSIGLQFALPLYQGGAISSREREAAALSLRAKEDLENARRTAALTSRQTYLTVINGIAQIGALEQARVSSQSALESNKLGYEVGVRINIDVLNAQQQLYSTERDLAVARYNTITNQLRLKAAAGSLREEDLEEVNRALAP